MWRTLAGLAVMVLISGGWLTSAGVPDQPQPAAASHSFITTGYTPETPLAAGPYLRQELVERLERAFLLERADRENILRFREEGGIPAKRFLCKHRI